MTDIAKTVNIFKKVIADNNKTFKKDNWRKEFIAFCKGFRVTQEEQTKALLELEDYYVEITMKNLKEP